jgi:hypothetical protein
VLPDIAHVRFRGGKADIAISKRHVCF